MVMSTVMCINTYATVLRSLSDSHISSVRTSVPLWRRCSGWLSTTFVTTTTRTTFNPPMTTAMTGHVVMTSPTSAMWKTTSVSKQHNYYYQAARRVSNALYFAAVLLFFATRTLNLTDGRAPLPPRQKYIRGGVLGLARKNRDILHKPGLITSDKGVIIPGVCLFVCLFVCLSVINFT